MQPYGSLLVWESCLFLFSPPISVDDLLVAGFFSKKWQVLDTQTGREKHELSISRLIPGDFYWWWLDPSIIAIRRQRAIHTLAITDPTAKPVKILDLDPSFDVEKALVSSNSKRNVWLCSGVVSRSSDRSRAWYLHFPGIEREERLAADYCALELVTVQGRPIDVLFTARGLKDRVRSSPMRQPRNSSHISAGTPQDLRVERSRSRDQIPYRRGRLPQWFKE